MHNNRLIDTSYTMYANKLCTNSVVNRTSIN